MHRKSYWKTIALTLAINIFALVVLVILNVAQVSGLPAVVASFTMKIIVLVASLIIAGGLICLWRDRRIELGLYDHIGASLKGNPPFSLLSALGLRSLLGQAPRPGDIVEVRSLEEIQQTLDADSTLDGLPFMPEMHEYCGSTFRVHRRVDKIYDMRNKTGMRRLCDAVSLTAVRCNGVHHDGCQAECYVLWKDAWLRRVPSSGAVDTCLTSEVEIAADTYDNVTESYICQMTRLWEATLPMSRFDIRQDLRPLLSGNVSLWVYLIVLLTRLFDTVQCLRGGVYFPHMTLPIKDNSVTQVPKMSLAADQRVMIQSRAHIAQTLINSRTKGLWYDRDMIRFCGNPGVVYKPVDKIIHEGTGKMLQFKAPCWILRDITATGEFQRFNPQLEYTYWKEAWLHPQETKKGTPSI